MSLQEFLVFFSVIALLTISPGADTFLVIKNSFSGGYAYGVKTTLGICSGLIFHAVFSVLGISVLLVQSAEVFQIVKTIGGIYIIYLAFLSIKSGLESKKINIKAQTEITQKRRAIFINNPFYQGMLTNILNPKVALFYLSIIPQFIPVKGNPFFYASLIALTHILLGLVWLFLIVFFIHKFKEIFEKFKGKFEIISGAVLALLGLKLILKMNNIKL